MSIFFEAMDWSSKKYIFRVGRYNLPHVNIALYPHQTCGELRDAIQKQIDADNETASAINDIFSCSLTDENVFSLLSDSNKTLLELIEFDSKNAMYFGSIYPTFMRKVFQIYIIESDYQCRSIRDPIPPPLVMANL